MSPALCRNTSDITIRQINLALFNLVRFHPSLFFLYITSKLISIVISVAASRFCRNQPLSRSIHYTIYALPHLTLRLSNSAIMHRTYSMRQSRAPTASQIQVSEWSVLQHRPLPTPPTVAHDMARRSQTTNRTPLHHHPPPSLIVSLAEAALVCAHDTTPPYHDMRNVVNSYPSSRTCPPTKRSWCLWP
jgi:hypothetical protein